MLHNKNYAYEATTGTTTTIAALIDIITNAITAGNTNNVPAQLQASKQNYFVKTGQYNEVGYY